MNHSSVRRVRRALGAVLFFAILSVGIVLLLMIPGIVRFVRNWRSDGEIEPDAGAGDAAVAPTLAILLCIGLGFGSAPSARAKEEVLMTGAPPSSRRAGTCARCVR